MNFSICRVICVFFCVVATGCTTEIESGLSSSDANRAIVALVEHGIAARRIEESSGGDSSFRIAVASSEAASALRVLQEEGIPGERHSGFLETFGEGGLVPTPAEERARWASALGGELSRSLEAIDGVLEARVHLALPEESLLVADHAPEPPRASVLVRRRAGGPALDAAMIKTLVAGAVPGLAEERVAVTMVEAPRPSAMAAGFAEVGPFAVARGSEGPLKATLAGLLLSNLIVASLAAWVVARRSVRRS